MESSLGGRGLARADTRVLWPTGRKVTRSEVIARSRIPKGECEVAKARLGPAGAGAAAGRLARRCRRLFSPSLCGGAS
jgi:hypothetical protein